MLPLNVVDGYGDSNINLLHCHLEEDMVRQILAIPAPNDDMHEDRPMWRWNHNRVCTISSAFHKIGEREWNLKDKKWNMAWDYDGPQRLKQYIWIVLRNRLMTNVERTRCGLSTDPMSGLDRDAYHWRLIFGIIIWRLWKQRNAFVFNGQPSSTAMKNLRQRWHSPKMGVAKLNTDGAADPRTMEASSGGLIRDGCGHWITGFHRNIRRFSAFQAEIWALYNGLLLAWNSNIKDVEAEIDNKEVVNTLNGIPHMYETTLIRRIRELSHTKREANEAADALAHINSNTCLGLMVFQNPPDEVRHILVHEETDLV
ncbi:hypothetical protein F3Y22_tig00110890pilonHSYRG01660 [Hibiscus syriacus]|uniref:RNase H type-1 domain-containing protein n=1 Tax=Hibiscus syriacus TaxID=106335 RepID=A0A6A2ZIL2_HIBSY|nr:hypothetical protein F3Y22_tig00110890pilonHSYRG01660 [Hibiscus syriacus]